MNSLEQTQCAFLISPWRLFIVSSKFSFLFFSCFHAYSITLLYHGPISELIQLPFAPEPKPDPTGGPAGKLGGRQSTHIWYGVSRRAWRATHSGVFECDHAIFSIPRYLADPNSIFFKTLKEKTAGVDFGYMA